MGSGGVGAGPVVVPKSIEAMIAVRCDCNGAGGYREQRRGRDGDGDEGEGMAGFSEPMVGDQALVPRIDDKAGIRWEGTQRSPPQRR